jgi:CRP-like cAMP-binding protein
MKANYRTRLASNQNESINSNAVPGGSFKKHLEKFISISNDDFEKVMSRFSDITIDKNEYLIKEGSWVHHTYWVKSGLLLSTLNGDDGREHIIQFAIENCWITDQNAFYNRQKSKLNIIALEKSELLCLSHEDRETLCADNHLMEQFFRKKANDSFVKQQQRLITYLTADAKKRYELLLHEYPGIHQRISKKLLAAYLGVSRETLSRL